MKNFPALAALAAAGLLAGCGSSSNAPESTGPEPAETAPQEADPNDEFQSLAVNMVAQSGTYFPDGVDGVEFGCSDTLVTISTVPIYAESSEEFVTAAIQFLLDDSQYYHGDPAVTNSLTLSETLELQSVDVGRNAVDVTLSGDLEIRGECEAYRIQAQLYGTVATTAQLDDVSITVDGTELDDVLGLQPFDTTVLADDDV